MSPLQFVTVVCAVVAAAALGFLAAERLAKMLDGPHRGLALAGLILLNLIWAAIVAGLLFSTGDGGAPNFALLGLLPSVWNLRIADKPFPPAVRAAVVGIGAAVYLGLLGYAAWTFRNRPYDELVALLGAALLIAIIALVGGALYRIWLSVHEREKAKA
jgi:hypothetical protein